MKNILFIASEGVPFIKTGGLADVVGSLPKNIDKKYFDVRVMLPKYTCIKQELKDKANGLPLRPGVYIMMDVQGTVIYVGKAIPTLYTTITSISDISGYEVGSMNIHLLSY